jgi:hypothetical protein
MSAAVVLLRRKRLIRRFCEAGAVDPQHAVILAEIRERPSWIFRQMERAGAFIRTAEGRYYMDVAAAHEFMASRRKRALILATMVLVLFALMWLGGIITR